MGSEPVVVGGMAGIISQLTAGITSTTIFSVVGDVMPFVITMIPIALGLYLFIEKSCERCWQSKNQILVNLCSLIHRGLDYCLSPIFNIIKKGVKAYV